MGAGWGQTAIVPDVPPRNGHIYASKIAGLDLSGPTGARGAGCKDTRGTTRVVDPVARWEVGKAEPPRAPSAPQLWQEGILPAVRAASPPLPPPADSQRHVLQSSPQSCLSLHPSGLVPDMCIMYLGKVTAEPLGCVELRRTQAMSSRSLQGPIAVPPQPPGEVPACS